jgi:hypothetical protein
MLSIVDFFFVYVDTHTHPYASVCKNSIKIFSTETKLWTNYGKALSKVEIWNTVKFA